MTDDTDPHTEALLRLVPFAAALEMRGVLSTPDEVRIAVDWNDSRCTTGGLLHGGVVMSVADTAGAVCAFLNLPEGASTSTIESKVNFLGGVTGGTVTAVARPLHRGSTTIVLEVDVLDDEARRVARVVQTQAVLRPR